MQVERLVRAYEVNRGPKRLKTKHWHSNRTSAIIPVRVRSRNPLPGLITKIIRPAERSITQAYSIGTAYLAMRGPPRPASVSGSHVDLYTSMLTWIHLARYHLRNCCHQEQQKGERASDASAIGEACPVRTAGHQARASIADAVAKQACAPGFRFTHQKLAPWTQTLGRASAARRPSRGDFSFSIIMREVVV
jgi:hypothetical protein